MNSSNGNDSQQNVDNENLVSSGDAVAVTEFVVTPHVANDLLDSILGDLDLSGAEPPGIEMTEKDATEIGRYGHKPSHRLLYEAWKARKTTADDIKRQATNGHTSQVFDAIDAHRQTPEGKISYNDKRKAKRHADALVAGRTVQARNSNPTNEDRKAQKNKSKANRSPAQVERERDANTAARAASRAAKKKATEQAWKGQAIFD